MLWILLLLNWVSVELWMIFFSVINQGSEVRIKYLVRVALAAQNRCFIEKKISSAFACCFDTKVNQWIYLLFIVYRFRTSSLSSPTISIKWLLSSWAQGILFFITDATSSLTAFGMTDEIIPYTNSFSGSWVSFRLGRKVIKAWLAFINDQTFFVASSGYIGISKFITCLFLINLKRILRLLKT